MRGGNIDASRSLNYAGIRGLLYSSTPAADDIEAYFMYFEARTVYSFTLSNDRYLGRSVRWVGDF